MSAKKRSPRQRGGFSLIELAITITISSLFLVGLLKIYSLELERGRLETTKQRLQDMRTALNVFAATHGKLPCPASPSQGESTGEDTCQTGKPPPDVAVFAPEKAKDDTGMAVWTGAVPAQTLGLPVAETLDGWGNKLTYAVTLKLTQPDALMVNPPPEGSIGILNEKGENLIDNDGAGRFVVVSHGKSAKGAWSRESIHTPCDKRAMDGKNCDGDNIFVNTGFALQRGGFFYDDLLVHDMIDTGGDMAGKLAVCNARQAFYSPDDPEADTEGCTPFSKYVWQGICNNRYNGGENGAPKETQYTFAVLEPPVVTNAAGKTALSGKGECDCPAGYTIGEIGDWRDLNEGTKGIEVKCGIQTTMGDGTMGTPNDVVGKSWFSDENGKPLGCKNTKGIPPSGRTALYTCIRQ